MDMVQHYSSLNRPSRPDCSICIANFNGASLLSDCLDSILNQDGDFSLEIIVHDDASTDDSLFLLREKYSQVEILSSQSNVGFCVSNNRMVAHARGRFVLLLNNDAALLPDAIITMLRAASMQQSCGVLTLPQYDWSNGLLVDRGCLLDPFYNPMPNILLGREHVAMTIGACLFLPRELWSELGGFPEWFESIGEDLYLCCQARLRGKTVQVTAESGYRHRQGVSFGGNKVAAGRLRTTYRRRRLSERNKTATLFICTPTILMWPLLIIHIFLLVTEGLCMAILTRSGLVWREVYGAAMLHNLRMFRTLCAARKLEQSFRRVNLFEYLSVFRIIPRKLQLILKHGVPTIY